MSGGRGAFWAKETTEHACYSCFGVGSGTVRVYGAAGAEMLPLCDGCAQGLGRAINSVLAAKLRAMRRASLGTKKGPRTIRLAPARYEALSLLVAKGEAKLALAQGLVRDGDAGLLLSAPIACWLVEHGYAVERLAGGERRYYPTDAGREEVKRPTF